MTSAPCEVCGNPVGRGVAVCPYCGTPQVHRVAGSPKEPKIALRTVSLKQGQPTVEEAVEVLRRELSAANADGIAILKLIHGYGSTGKGGAIRGAVRSRLIAWKKQGLIKSWYTGEEYFDMGRKNNPLIRKAPELDASWAGDKGNPGITLVVL